VLPITESTKFPKKICNLGIGSGPGLPIFLFRRFISDVIVSCMMYLLDLVERLFGHAYITDPTIFRSDQHIEDKKRKRRMGSKSTAYAFYKYRLTIKGFFYLSCRCSKSFAHDRSVKLESFDPSLTIVSSSGDNVIFFGPPVPHGNKHEKVFEKNTGSSESANASPCRLAMKG
jgi:hypothetical protein